MKIIRGIEQNTPEWMEMRLGSIGGSSMNSVLAKGQGKLRKTLLYKLAGEILTGQQQDGYHGPQFDRGHEYEPKLRAYYELMTGNDVEQVTMILSDTPGRHHSPDGIVEPKKGGVEGKTRAPHIFLELVETEKIPIADMRQCQNFLDITEWDWIDYVVYCVPEMPSCPGWIKRIYPDEKMIREIRVETTLFLNELNALVERMK